MTSKNFNRVLTVVVNKLNQQWVYMSHVDTVDQH